MTVAAGKLDAVQAEAEALEGVEVHGDMQHEVNRGLKCVKGYFLSKIMNRDDRLTTPLMRAGFRSNNLDPDARH